MKKLFIAIFTVAASVSANAQIIKSNLLKDAKEGAPIETGVYGAKDDAARLDAWSGAFVSKPTAVESPVVVAPLSYPGYNEGGPAIKLGTPKGVKGTRFSVYTIGTKKEYSKGALYLSCLVNFARVGGDNWTDVLGLSANATGASNRAAIKVKKQGNDGILFATNVNKAVAECPTVFDYDKTHLVVLKLDYANQKVSLFVDPKAGADEPAEADVVASGDEENVLKHAIRSISLRNRSGHDGAVGSIRLARSWASIFE